MNPTQQLHAGLLDGLDSAVMNEFEGRGVRVLSRAAERHEVIEWLGVLETQKPGVRVYLSLAAWQQSDRSVWVQSAIATDNLAGTARQEVVREQLLDASGAFYVAQEVIIWALKYADNAVSEAPDANMLLPDAIPKAQASSANSDGERTAETESLGPSPATRVADGYRTRPGFRRSF